MVQSFRDHSLDEDNRRFVPDEVFETLEEARETLDHLIDCYGSRERAPLVYAVLLRIGEYIGYVQAVPYGEGWEIGYHIGAAYAGRGYATEAVGAFLPVILAQLGVPEIVGVCLEENQGSCRVLEKCGFHLSFQGTGPYQGQERALRTYTYVLPGAGSAGQISCKERPPASKT